LVLVDPLVALGVSFMLLGAMLYKRVSIGVALVSTAMILSVLSMNPTEIVAVFLETTTSPLTISLVLVTFGIMLLSLLYKETQALEALSSSFSGLLRNPKLIVSTLPAIIGLLPVPGGALMSAPLVETEAEKLGLERDQKTYVNVWFRHIIFPIYPMSQVLILAAALTGIPIVSIVMSQLPVVAVMTVVGYFVVLRKARIADDEPIKMPEIQENLKIFLKYFSPILLMILTVVILGVDVSIAAFVGIGVLLFITKPRQRVLIRTISDIAVYKIALAAYGAMLLRSATMASGVSEVLGQIIATSRVSEIVLLASLPAILGFLVGSPSGGIAISVPILAGTLSFSVGSASLLYISAYFGYLAAPTHLCLALTADYFKCRLGRVYKLLVPSLVSSFAVALVVYCIS
jgi:integral membrane protein (TIGR00529 family)